MQCKDVQRSLSCGDSLSGTAQTHVSECAECFRHWKAVEAIDSQAHELRKNVDPVNLPGLPDRMARKRFRLTPQLVGLAAALLIAAPAASLLLSRSALKQGENSWRIGSWPTYHCVTKRYQILANASSPLGSVTEVDEDWVSPDAARCTRRAGSIVLSDFIIREKYGLPLKFQRMADGAIKRYPDANGYYYSPDGHVKQDPHASQSFSPFSDDLRWLVDIPRDFPRLKTTTTPDASHRMNGTPGPVIRVTVASPNGESMVVAFKDGVSGRVLALDHFDTIRDNHNRVVASLARDYSMAFSFNEPEASRFDTATLEKSAPGTAAAAIGVGG